MTLNQLAKMFAKEYAVVSLKFVKSQLRHPKHPHANDNAKTLLESAGFVRGQQVSLEDPANPSGYTSTICYWRRDYFDGVAPDYKTMQRLANKKSPGKVETVAAPVADQEKLRLAQEAFDRARLGIPKGWKKALEEESCSDQPDDDDFADDFNIVEMTLITRHLLDETIKNYLRTLPVDHQRAFCSLFEAVNCDVSGVCTLTDEDGTVHTFQALPLPEETRRYYNTLMNMFYQDDERWGPFILWLEEQSKPVDDSWKKLLQKPYSESLQRSYFFLTDLQALFVEKSAALIESRFSH